MSGTDEQMAAFGAAFSRPMADNDDWQKTWTTLSQMYFREYDPAVGDKLDADTIYNFASWNMANALLATYNTIEGLKSVPAPALQVAGRHDGICSPSQGAERIDSLMPNSSVAIFENSAHYPFIEDEAAFFEKVRAWMSAHS